MEITTSDKIFLDAFETNFAPFRHQPIALYGIGEKTRLILEHAQGFNFIGLMDKDTTGQTMYGMTIVSDEETIGRVGMIIIVANMSLADMIYDRIAFLRRNYGISVRFINGTAPRDVDETVLNNPYWNKTETDLRSVIEENDVISFDLFDTLVMRSVLVPTDVFDAVERTLAEKYAIRIDFKKKRIEAELHTYGTIDPYCSIHAIYRTLGGMLGIDDHLVRLIKNVEVQTELASCIPRKTMAECYRYAKNRGKYVVITTDTFLTREYVRLLLTKCDIPEPSKLLISCEDQKSKHHGNLLYHLKELSGEKSVVHIGDNTRSDGDMAKKAGLAAFGIGSARDLLDMSALKDLIPLATTFDDRRILGHLASRFLNDPFALHGHKGRMPIDSPFKLGYLSFGPLVMKFLLWLMQKCSEAKIETLLFFARDGYILERLYRNIVKESGIDAPESVYFLTSRRAASVASIRAERDIAFIVNKICKIKKITIGRLLFTAFGIQARQDDPLATTYFHDVTEEVVIDHLTTLYLEAILDNAREERTRYLRYIDDLGIHPEKTVGCVNFVGWGITQRFLSAIMEKPLLGFYFAAEHAMSDVLGSLDGVFAMYGTRLSQYTDRSALLTKALFGEVVFSSPDEQFVKFDEGMRPVFDERRKERNFAFIGECHKGMERFVETMINGTDDILGMRISLDLVDGLYGLFSSPACCCSEQVKSGFVFDDYYNPDASQIRLRLP